MDNLRKEELRRAIHEIIDEEINNWDNRKRDEDTEKKISTIRKVLSKDGNYEQMIDSGLDDEGYVFLDSDQLKDLDELDREDYYRLTSQIVYYYYDKGVRKLKRMTNAYGIASATVGVGQLFTKLL